MNLPRVAPSTDRSFGRLPWLLLCALALAIGLMTVYVSLLHESMARGDQMREAQRTAPQPKFSKVGETVNLLARR